MQHALLSIANIHTAGILPVFCPELGTSGAVALLVVSPRSNSICSGQSYLCWRGNRPPFQVMGLRGCFIPVSIVAAKTDPLAVFFLMPFEFLNLPGAPCAGLRDRFPSARPPLKFSAPECSACASVLLFKSDMPHLKRLFSALPGPAATIWAGDQARVSKF